MTALNLIPGQLSLAQLRDSYQYPVKLSLDNSAAAQIEASVACVEQILAENRTAYGINTGFGLLASTRIASEDLENLQRSLVLSHAAGADGMVAGQVIDTLCGVSTQQELTGMYRLKTGVMISAAAELGCVASGMPATMRQQAIAFADKLGLAFQIRDDMLDVVGDEAVFGKPIGSDREEGKVTFVDVLGLEGCRTAVEECTRRAEEAILPWPDHDFLLTLAHSLEERKK